MPIILKVLLGLGVYQIAQIIKIAYCAYEVISDKSAMSVYCFLGLNIDPLLWIQTLKWTATC